MKQVQIAKASAAKSAEQIVKKLVGEVEALSDPGDVWQKHFILVNEHFPEVDGPREDAYGEIEAFGRFTHTDFALELRGSKLWLFSISVKEVRK